MFDWLNDIVRAVLTLIPRPVLIKKTDGGVIFTRGHVKAVGAGLWWYWPVWSSVSTIPVVRQTLNLTYQSLIASDGEAVVLAVTVVYEVSDVELALTSTDNIIDTIQDLSHWAVKRVVSRCSSSELQAGVTGNGKKIDSILRARIQTDLTSYGIRVRNAFVAEFSRPYMIRLMGDYNPS